MIFDGLIPDSKRSPMLSALGRKNFLIMPSEVKKFKISSMVTSLRKFLHVLLKSQWNFIALSLKNYSFFPQRAENLFSVAIIAFDVKSETKIKFTDLVVIYINIATLIFWKVLLHFNFKSLHIFNSTFEDREFDIIVSG